MLDGHRGRRGRPPLRTKGRRRLAELCCNNVRMAHRGLVALLVLLYGVPSSGSSIVDLSDESGCCGPPGLVCSGANFSGVVEETLYFAHPENPGGSFDWGNHDMADALGEAVSCAGVSFCSPAVSSCHIYRKFHTAVEAPKT